MTGGRGIANGIHTTGNGCHQLRIQPTRCGMRLLQRRTGRAQSLLYRLMELLETELTFWKSGTDIALRG